ncbi:hypothetical protein RB628_17795 [Streptomyces sp. ADMS]|uniref:hypothetical protein n=1 Tax=Streptomyces sp. ADMS TaxID=3071415 RepID=UPI00296F1983|nr:hypothetical protein [Streptomyces sp. ADMS]MDW4907150.1 hypothetical protein [Streptomyces sp. ADMS]
MDEYVPLTVQWAGYSRLRDAPRSVVLDIGDSLVEIKPDRNDGEVVEVVLVELVRPECFDDLLDIAETTEIEINPGVPCVSFDESDQEDSEGSVRLYTDGLRIRFAGGRAVRRVGDMKAMFGFSDLGHLVEFAVRLEPDLMARLRALCDGAR